LRGLLRDYRDKARHHINQLREELSRTAQGLARLVDSMSQHDGDHESRLRQALKTIRDLAQEPAAAPIAHVLRGVGDTIDRAMEQFRQQQQLTVSQFLGEISQLHKRIDALESEASKDELTKLFNRSEMEARLRLVQEGGSLLLLNVQGVRLAAVQFSHDVAHQLAAAFVKRLRNIVAPDALVGRWSEEEFLVLHPAAKNEALGAAKQLTQALSGAYACQQAGKTVRPGLQVGVAVMDFVPGGQVEHTLEKINQFFKG
jgi:diguanylate cyclase (GGDEF)-like protein